MAVNSQELAYVCLIAGGMMAQIQSGEATALIRSILHPEIAREVSFLIRDTHPHLFIDNKDNLLF